MSNLTDFLRKLVDHVGASSLNTDIDKLENDDAKGEEETPNAAE